MNEKNVLQELQELNLLWSGLSQIPNFPKELLELSLAKLEIINSLLQNSKDDSASLTAIPDSSQHQASAAIVESLVVPPIITQTPVVAQESLLEAGDKSKQITRGVGSKLPKQQPAKSESLMDRYEKNHSKESLQRKLESKHFADLSKALSLNDRFRFQRDLFGNSSEKMNKTLQELNQLNSMEQALDYMHRHYAMFEESESFTDFCTLLENHYSC